MHSRPTDFGNLKQMREIARKQRRIAKAMQRAARKSEAAASPERAVAKHGTPAAEAAAK
jgi:hypothetical protein